MNNELVTMTSEVDTFVGKQALVSYLAKPVLSAKGIALLLLLPEDFYGLDKKSQNKILASKAATVARSFARDSAFFNENEDYFNLTHIEAKELSNELVANGGGKFYAGGKGMTLFTETGALKLASKLKTVKAWDVVQRLIIGYIVGRAAKDETNTHLASIAVGIEAQTAKQLTEGSNNLQSTKDLLAQAKETGNTLSEILK